MEDDHIFVPQTHLTFGKEFTEAVEMKQVAQQEAERARFVVEKVSVSREHQLYPDPVFLKNTIIISPL